MVHFSRAVSGAVRSVTIAVLAGCVATAAWATDIPTPKVNAEASALVPQAVRDRGVIQVVSTFGYAPQQFYAEDGSTPAGLSVDLANAMGAAVGLPVTFSNASFDSLIPGLDAGRFDMVIAAMSATAERGAKVNFVIYQKTDARILVRAGNPKSINGLQDLCGLKVASLKGSLYNQVIDGVSAKCVEKGKEAVELSTYDSSDSVYQALIAGRVDANYRDSAPLIYTAQASEGRLEVVGPEYPDTPYGIAFAGGNADFANAMALALDSIIVDGTYQAILDKWGLGSRAVDKAVMTAVGSPADAYPRAPSAIDIDFGN